MFQSIFYFTLLLAEVPAGYIGDIFPRKNVLIFSYLLFMARIIMWLTCPNYFTILLGEIFYGLSKAFYRGVSDSYIYEYVKVKNIPKNMITDYGKFNFYMSTGSAISCLLGAWLYQYWGFSVLLTIELCCNSAAIIMLFFLSPIPCASEQRCFSEHFKMILNIFYDTLKNSKMNVYMIYCGILTGITSVFVYNFQPYMKFVGIPVAIFGLVYFVNHMLRAIGSLEAKFFIEKLTIQKTALFVWILYIISFILFALSVQSKNILLCLAVLLFICICIGVQIVFNVASIARIHNLIKTNMRASVSSVNFLFASLFSGVFLMINKFLVDYFSTGFVLLIFLLIFLFTVLLVKQILRTK